MVVVDIPLVAAGIPLVVEFAAEDNLVVLDTLMVDMWRLTVGTSSVADMWR